MMIPAKVGDLAPDEDGIHVLQGGVCTHPGYTGRGYARRLTRALLYRHRRRGLESFLHVSESNSAARSVYESMGFVVSGSVELGKVERATPAAKAT